MTGSSLRGSRILITGGAGFIGSHIADQLLAAEVEHITVIDDFERGSSRNLADACASGRVQLVQGDIRDAALVDDLTAGTDYVFHQAALRITQCAAEPQKALEVMAVATQHVLDSAVRHGVKKVLAASSASVYGEPSYLPMDEAHPFNNRTLYGATKIANEQMFRSYAEMFGLRYVMLRPFNIYGPRMDVFGAYTEVMIRWLERLRAGCSPVIFGDGSQTMDFLYVEDLARAYILAAESDVTDIVVNAGSGTETSLLQLCAELCAAAGQPGVQPEFQAPRAVNPVTRRQASISLAREVLGFEATTPLSEGLSRLISWHRGVTEQALAGAK